MIVENALEGGRKRTLVLCLAGQGRFRFAQAPTCLWSIIAFAPQTPCLLFAALRAAGFG